MLTKHNENIEIYKNNIDKLITKVRMNLNNQKREDLFTNYL